SSGLQLVRECNRYSGSRRAVAQRLRLLPCFLPARAAPDCRQTAMRSRSLPTIYKYRNPNTPARAGAYRSFQSAAESYPFARSLRAAFPSRECLYLYSPPGAATRILLESSLHARAHFAIWRTANAPNLELPGPSSLDRTKAGFRSRGYSRT